MHQFTGLRMFVAHTLAARPSRPHRASQLRWIGRAALACVLVLLPLTQTLAAQPPLPASRPAAPKAEPVRVRLALNRPIDGAAIPYLEALTGGRFRAAGTDVTITSEGSSQAVLDAVAKGTIDVGIVDLNTLIRFRGDAAKPKIKSIFVIYNRSPHAIIARKSRGITTIADLVGKKLGVTPDNDVNLQWPALAEINKIDAAKVSVEKIDPLVRAPMLSAGQIDAVTGLTFRTPVDIKDRGVPADDLIVLQAADSGYPLYGDAVIVNPAFAEKNSDAVRGFLAGLVQGLNASIAKPEKVAQQTLKIADPQTLAVELDRWQTVIRSCIVTAEVKGAGLGLANADRLAQSIQIVLGPKLAPTLKADDVFDASFLPAPASLVVR